MKKETTYLPSKCDGLLLYTTVFVPNGKCKGIIQFSHGMCEHQKYYYDIMKFFCSKGYVCVIFDQRGHGESVVKEDDFGYFGDEKANYLVEDFYMVTRYIKKQYPNVPIYLFGHSMGSLVVRKYLKKYDSEVKKVVVCGSPSDNKLSILVLLLCKVLKLIKGERYRSSFLNNIILTNDPPEKWLTINMDYVEQIKDDHLSFHLFTINGFLNLIHLFRDVYSKKGWVLNNENLEILFISGERDIVMRGRDNFLKSANFMKQVGYSNISFKLYKKCKHAVFIDNPEDVYNDVLNFIEK